MKISTWPIKNILMIFIAITITIQSINYTVSLYLADRMKGGIEKLVKEAEELKEVTVFIEEVALVSINIRDALLQDDREETRKLINKTNEELKKAEHEIDILSENALYADDKAIIESLRKPLAQYSKILHKAEDLELSGKHEESVKLVLTEGNKSFHAIEALAKKLEESIISHEHKQQKQLYFYLTEQFVVSTVIFAITLFLVALLIFIRKSITRTVKTNLDQFDQACQNLDMSVDLDTQGKSEFVRLNQAIVQIFENISITLSASRQAAQTLGAATNELSSTTDQCNRNFEIQNEQTQQVQSNMNKANDLVESVEQSLTSLHSQIDEIKGKTSFAKDGMVALQEKSEKISGFVTLIEDISDQVNLLALNAAIEAARAGDAGRGFAVVADEVRKLAGQTNESANNIRDGIGELAQFVTKVSGDLSATQDSVDKTMAHMEDASNKSNEQLTTFREVNDIVSEFTLNTRENMSSIQQIAEATNDLAQEATDLENQISRFQLRKV